MIKVYSSALGCSFDFFYLMGKVVIRIELFISGSGMFFFLDPGVAFVPPPIHPCSRLLSFRNSFAHGSKSVLSQVDRSNSHTQAKGARLRLRRRENATSYSTRTLAHRSLVRARGVEVAGRNRYSDAQHFLYEGRARTQKLEQSIAKHTRVRPQQEAHREHGVVNDE